MCVFLRVEICLRPCLPNKSARKPPAPPVKMKSSRVEPIGLQQVVDAQPCRFRSWSPFQCRSSRQCGRPRIQRPRHCSAKSTQTAADTTRLCQHLTSNNARSVIPPAQHRGTTRKRSHKVPTRQTILRFPSATLPHQRWPRQAPLAVYGMLQRELIPSLWPSTTQHDGAPLGLAYWAWLQLLNRPVAHHRWLARAGVASRRPLKPGRRGHKEGPVLVETRRHVRVWQPGMEDIVAHSRHGRCVVRKFDHVVPAPRGRVSVQHVRARRSLPGEKEEGLKLIRPAE